MTELERATDYWHIVKAARDSQIRIYNATRASNAFPLYLVNKHETQKRKLIRAVELAEEIVKVLS